MYFQQRIELPAAVALLSKGNCVARALYDNVADTPDELAFRKGDLLTVLEQNPNGLEGWWLCSFRGRQGICPANRVRLIPRVYDAGTLSTAGLNAPSMPGTPTGNNSHSFLNTNAHASLSNSGGSGGSSGGSTCSSKSNSSTGSGPSAALLGHVTPKAAFQEVRGPVRLNKIVKPVRSGDAFTYDVPRAGFSFDRDETDAAGQGNYDLPPVPRPVTLPQAMECYDVPRATTGFGMAPNPGLQDYDVPRNHSTLRPKKAPFLAARGAAVAAASDDSDFDRPKEEDDGTYDIPRAMDQLSISGPSEDYDVPARSKRLSDRSSGVSLLSSSSSGLSAASSVSSESLSLSSVGASGSQSGRSSSISLEVYDVPPSAVGDNNNSRRVLRNHPVQDVYDVPPSRSAFSTPPPPSGNLEDYDVPKSLKSTQQTLYDVPPQALRFGSCSVNSSPRLSTISDSSSRDSRDLADLPPRELPLELDSAVETLSRLHQEVSSSINRLLSFTATASTSTSTGSVLKSSAYYWRKRENLEPKLMDLRLASVRLQTALQEFVDFAMGTLGNAAKSTDHSLAHKLLRLTRPLQDSNNIVHKAIAAVESRHWSLQWSGSSPSQTDELDQLVACSRALTEDVRQVTSFIQGNAPLLFKRASGVSIAVVKDMNKKIASVDHPEKDKAANHEWIEDYDYVNLESKAKFDQENEEIKKSLPQDMKKSFDVLVTESQALLPPEKATLTANDKNVVDFYASQAETYIQYLTNAIDSFIVTIGNNQPPKVFIAYSKFIILNAYKLVSVGDAVHRNVTQEPLKSKVLEKSNALCDGLKASVQATKKAGREFPSVVAVQEMLDSVVHVSQLAQQLKLSIRPM